MFAALIPVSRPGPTERLREAVIRELENVPGTFAVAFRDLRTGEELLLRDREVFHAASMMKLPVMIEVYRQAAEKRLSLSDSLLIDNAFESIVDGSPFRLGPESDSDTAIYGRIGGKRTLSSLVYDMIILSSNLATNLVIERVGARNVTATARRLGARDLQVLRGVEDGKAFAKGLNNTVTAFDLMQLLTVIAEGRAVGPEASRAMIDILLDQRFNTILPANLPKDVRVAHKTGWITGVLHDGGIVFLPDGRRYVLVLLSKNVKDEPAARQTLAKVSELVYRHMVR
ncbi:serine hydrolase [Larkinella soli]|uniref:serine hydrolase n=1 Tax=Larkinella soli TaxID=1770527 RepID=UPI001E4C299F|nr:serine hydrolase [Larkinella soli]